MTSYNKFEKAWEAILSMRSCGQIDENIQNKMLVSLAQGAVDEGDPDSAVSILRSIPTPYFTDTMPKQFRQDPVFEKKATGLARFLVEKKLSDPGCLVIPNMCQGQA